MNLARFSAIPLLFGALAVSAMATTRWVNDDDPNGGGYAAPGTGPNDPGYATIQAAINASASGDKIMVADGTYTEQVTIPAGMNNLDLKAQHHWGAMIKAPAAMVAPGAIVWVNGATGVSIKDFVIGGPSAGWIGPFGLNLYGVRVDGGGSASIENNHITDIRNDPFSGVQGGVAIQVGRRAEGQTGSATIKNNLIDNYQKNGMTIDNVGSSAVIQGNEVVGAGPTTVTAQNGIQISRGAGAVIKDNKVSGNLYTPPSTTATGILVFHDVVGGELTIQNNDLTGNGVGAYVFGEDRGTVKDNTATSSLYDGIAIESSSNMLVENNRANGNGWGVSLYSATNNAVRKNRADNNQNTGILADSGTSGNLFDGNSMKNNMVFDAEDDSIGTGTANTANTWRKNKLDTDNKSGGLGN